MHKHLLVSDSRNMKCAMYGAWMVHEEQWIPGASTES